KQADVNKLDAEGKHFRGHSAAASLKPYAVWSQAPHWNDFRGHSAAASLKRHGRVRPLTIRCRFPRSFGRGLIEALQESFAPSPPANFRGHSAAASLKRPMLSTACVASAISAVIRPRPH